MLRPPNLNALYNSVSYTDIYLYTLLWNIGLFGMISLVLFLVCFSLKFYQITRNKMIEKSRQSLLTYQQSSRYSEYTQTQSSKNGINQQSKGNQKQINGKKPINLFDVINFLTSFFFYLTLIPLSLVYFSYHIFGKFGTTTGYDILAVVVMTSTMVLPTILWKYTTKTKQFQKIKVQVILSIVLLSLWVILTIIAVIMLRGACVCTFNDRYGIKITKNEQFSSVFTRSQEIQKVCKDNQLCQLYATLAENASNSVFINMHTGTSIKQVIVHLSNLTDQYVLQNSPFFELTQIQQIGQRFLYSFYFNGLMPDTFYKLTVIEKATNRILYETNYQTLPDKQGQIRLAVGGDVGMRDQANNLTSYLISFNPHAIIIGGDITYDDAMRTCWYSWDNLYDMLNETNFALKRVVPIILSVGNHDVGFNALSNVKIKMDNETIPYYFLYNPQHLNSERNGIPNLKERKTSHFHILGSTIQVHLDSGYVLPHENQTSLLERINNQFPNHYKFANYHNPIYPSCYDKHQQSNDMKVINQGIKHWIPLFDSGKFTAAFQHHTHHRKFTYKIKGNEPQNTTGVRFLGDGSWGVPEGACPEGHITERTEYFQYFQSEHPNHIWKIRIWSDGKEGDKIEYTAIDLHNNIVFQITDIL